MQTSDKNNFPLQAKTRLLERGWSVTDLANEIGRPRSSVSVAIHTNKFPEIKAAIIKTLKLTSKP